MKLFKNSIVYLTIILLILGIWIISKSYSTAFKNDLSINVIALKEYNGGPNIINDFIEYNSVFELPINGSTGYASLDTTLIDINGNLITNIKAGDGFTILSENNNYLLINYNNQKGYINKNYTLINLPDVIPSIIYKNTNSSSSIMKSSFKNINDITGEKLYDVYTYNNRLNKNEYIMPVLYPMALKIAEAQKIALNNNDTLILYETYRPYETQKLIVKNLTILANEDEEVKKGLSSNPWSMTWFISTKTSNHQKGLAIDVSLGSIKEYKKITIGNYIVKNITNYEEYEMPTKMHELSLKSARFASPVSSNSKTAWKNAKLTSAMQNSVGALKLQDYCTNAGLTPLASEWWHYNDLDCLSFKNGNGRFIITNNYSILPE